MKMLRHAKGFTVVELLVVITIIVGLSLLTIFAIGSWRTRTANTEVKTALAAATTALKDYKNFNDGYPTGSPPTLPSSFEPMTNATVTYISGTASTYCLRGTSTAITTVIWYVTQASSTPQPTACT